MEERPPKKKPTPRYNPMNPGVPKPRKPRIRSDTKGSKKCFALGCNNRTIDNNMKLFVLPKNETIRDIWIRFSRRGNEYDVKKNTYLCQEHFDPACFLYKQKKTFLLKNSIPTIFIRQTRNGPERTLLTFDQSILHYVEEDTFLKPISDLEGVHSQIVEKCHKKLRNIRHELCRFCFADSGEKLVRLSSLKDYGVNINEMLNFIGLNMQQDNLFSDLACEECFQELVGFDGYRKRCQKAQQEILIEIRNLKNKIEMYGGDSSAMEVEDSFKVEGGWTNDDLIEFDPNYSTPVEVLMAYDKPSPCKKSSNEPSFQHIVIKEETKDEPMSDDDFEYALDSDDNFNESYVPNVSLEEEFSSFSESKAKNKPKKSRGWKKSCEKKVLEETDITEAVQNDSSTIVTSTKLQTIANALYECFTCKKRIAGRKTFEAHKCDVPLMCQFPECGSTFTKMGGFVTHSVKMHKLPRVHRKMCKVCKLSWVVTDDDFLDHSKKCKKDDEKAESKTIDCQLCGKRCKNIKAYTVHQMFHDQDPTYPKTAEQLKEMKLGTFICETCGDEFHTRNILSSHIRRKHTITETNPDGTEKTICEVCGRECMNSYRLKIHKQNIHGLGKRKPIPVGIFTCDICGQQRISRLAIYDHIRRTHVNDPSPCHICGKVFRHPSLLKTHMKYHTTPMHTCLMCSDKAYATAQALRRHQESNHGLGPGYPCDYCPAIYKTRVTLSTHRWDVHGVKGPLRKK